MDEKAIEAVRRRRLEPAIKDGQPVAVLVNIEVKFQLYECFTSAASSLFESGKCQFGRVITAHSMHAPAGWS
jgi:Gram-negative bacterial TonB protein C-terminal